MKTTRTDSTDKESETDTIHFRPPTLNDGAEIWKLIKESPPLDLNSNYSYLILCHHFADTCVVAEEDSEIVGFVSAYLPPNRDSVFIWQVAVKDTMRGRGLAGRMLNNLLSRPVCQSVQYLETTVTPSNAASRKLFQKLAEAKDTKCQEEVLFTKEMFAEAGHEEEVQMRIGPFK